MRLNQLRDLLRGLLIQEPLGVDRVGPENLQPMDVELDIAGR